MDLSQFAYPSPVDGHLEHSQVWTIMNKSTINFHVQVFRYTFHVMWIRIQEWNPCVLVYLQLYKKIPNCLTKWLHHCTYPTRPASSSSSTSSGLSSFYRSHLTNVWGYLLVVSIYPFLWLLMLAIVWIFSVPQRPIIGLVASWWSFLEVVETLGPAGGSESPGAYTGKWYFRPQPFPASLFLLPEMNSLLAQMSWLPWCPASTLAPKDWANHRLKPLKP